MCVCERVCECVCVYVSACVSACVCESVRASISMRKLACVKSRAVLVAQSMQSLLM